MRQLERYKLVGRFWESFAKVIQRRLQQVVEEVVPDSQCGFRKERGCIDMIFCARQLIEKAREHNTRLYMLFVDLRKAYAMASSRKVRHTPSV